MSASQRCSASGLAKGEFMSDELEKEQEIAEAEKDKEKEDEPIRAFLFFAQYGEPDRQHD